MHPEKTRINWSPAYSDLDLSLGVGAVYLPKYEGAKESRWRALPIIDIKWGPYFLGVGGLGVNVSTTPGLSFGPRLTYRRGRKESEAARLKGLGDLDAGAEAGAFFLYRQSAWSLKADLRTAVGDTPDGTLIGLGVGREFKFGQWDRLGLGVRVDWADKDYMQNYFGVSARQSANSGLPAHAAGAGLKSYGVSANWMHSFSSKWLFALTVHGKRLTGVAAASPTVERMAQLASSIWLVYRF